MPPLPLSINNNALRQPKEVFSSGSGWGFYREEPKFSQIIQSWDTGFKCGDDNSYSVCTSWGLTNNGYFLLSLWRGRAEFPELRRVLIRSS